MQEMRIICTAVQKFLEPMDPQNVKFVDLDNIVGTATKLNYTVNITVEVYSMMALMCCPRIRSQSEASMQQQLKDVVLQVRSHRSPFPAHVLQEAVDVLASCGIDVAECPAMSATTVQAGMTASSGARASSSVGVAEAQLCQVPVAAHAQGKQPLPGQPAATELPTKRSAPKAPCSPPKVPRRGQRRCG
jgi:hypothetical protein